MAQPEPTVEDALPFLRVDPVQAAKDKAAAIDAKKFVWVPTEESDLEGYVIAEITGATGEMVTVELPKGGGTKELKKDDCGQINPPKYEKCTDMANLTYLNEASVLYNLKQRYEYGMIYTYSGLFCIAINPYKRMPIYSDAVIKMYRGKRRTEVPPHVFAIVDTAYQDMLTEHDNQSMLITGESGAGKTENMKKVINYIAKVAGVEKNKDAAPAENAGGLKGTLDEQVVEANPLLEAFGNAKTTRNNNSSRFGKFVRCHFSQTGKLAGADIESYLLEKNRVIHQGSQERNYHIFYQMLYATTDEELAKFCLMTREAKDYGFLQKGVYHVDRIDDHEEWGMTTNSFKVLGFSEDETKSVLNITAGILNFSNMKFKQKPRDEQAEVEDPADGERVSYLLGLPVGEFHKSLIKPKVKVGTEFVNKAQSVTQVSYAVAALSKALFERLFLWIVARVNKALDTKERRSYFIGVLDIAGFEIFDYNSFEQLCINLTNEKLQQFFNHTMFVLEQDEYKKEGIEWVFVDFGMDLEETINLVEKPMGIFAMLEEECIVPKATDQTYLGKMHKEHQNNKGYGKPTAKQTKSGLGDFILHHYAGSVGYSVAGWLEKNKDPINEHTASLFSKATNPLVSHLFADYHPDKAGGRKKGSAFQTVSYRHKEQLKNMMTTLYSTTPHFVRCIIPNEKKQPGLIEGQLVLHQLRCNGVLEGIRICRKGFPSRMLFNDFKQRYSILAASAIPKGFVDGKVAAQKLLEALQLSENEYRIGNTKVFFRSGIVGELEEMRDERLSKIISQLQAYCKASLMREEFKEMCAKRVGIAVIQRNIRKFLMLRNWPWWKLYTKVQPMLSIARAEDDMKEKEEQLKKALEESEANERKRKELDVQVTDLRVEKDKLFNDLQAESERLIVAEESLMQTQAARDQLEKNLNEALEKLDGEEHDAAELKGKVQKANKQISELAQRGEEMNENISKLETERTSHLKQIEAMNADVATQDESISKLTKEKKHTEEQLNERTGQLQLAEDKANSLNKAKTKLEGQLQETKEYLSKEKDAKAKMDKEKKKVEGELKDMKNKLAEAEADLSATKGTVMKKEKAIRELENVQEGHENTIKQLQKKIQEMQSRGDELAEELETEQKLRQKVEMARKDLERELEEFQEQLEAQGGATIAQVEIIKKREAECARLRQEIEELHSTSEATAASAKSKFNSALAEAQDEAESVKKAKAKVEKDKSALNNELQDMGSKFEKMKKQKATADKNNRSLDEQLNELRGKLEETETNMVDAQNQITKITQEKNNTAVLLEEAEHKLGISTKNNKILESNLEEASQQAESEARAKHDANQKLQHALSEIDSLAEQLEEEANMKAALQIKLSKMGPDGGNKKGVVMSEEDAGRVEELEEAKRKLSARVKEMEEQLAVTESKSVSIEKMKAKMNDEVEDLLLELEKAQTQAFNLEKKQKKVDQQIHDWKLKCDEIQGDLDASQKDARTFGADILRLRASNEDIQEKYEAAKMENRRLTSDLLSINEKFDSGGKSSAEIEKVRRHLLAENEELQIALEEAEQHIEINASKFLKVQLDLTQSKQASERQLAEKDDELETNRKQHQRQIESLQATIENEVKTKNELHKSRKKFEMDIVDLESKLEAVTRNSVESQKTIKKLQAQIKELKGQLDENDKSRDEMRDSITKADRKANELSIKLDEARLALEQSERMRKLAENDKKDHMDRISEIQAFYNNAMNAKRKAEDDYHALNGEIEALENYLRESEDKAAKATNEVSRLMADQQSFHELTIAADKSRVMLAKQVSDLQQRLETAELSDGKGMKVQFKKMETRIIELENDLGNESRNLAIVSKQARQADKKNKEFEHQLEEERIQSERTQGASEKLFSKMKQMRVQIEELETESQTWQSRWKKASAELEDAEARCELAEHALQKARQKARTGPGGMMMDDSLYAGGPSRRASRQRSRLRTPAHQD